METGRVILNCRPRCSSAIEQIFACRVNLAPIFASVFLCAILNSVIATAQTKLAGEYQVKAAFLYNFAKFIDWPPNAFSDPKQPLSVCVYGHDPFDKVLEDSLLSKSIGERRISVGHASRLQDLEGCQLVFVAGADGVRIPDLVKHLHGRPVLLVGESEGFATSGGAIQFTIEDGRVRFVINPDAAERAGLKVSSKLLALATIVRDSNPSLAGSSLK